MFHVIGLIFPLFGLILLGYSSGRIKKLPIDGLSWLNFFVVYLALPALFFRLLSRTPIEEFAKGTFLIHTTLVTFITFVLCFTLTHLFKRGNTRIATIQGFAGSYGNIGYMGPPLAIAAFGPEAGVPVAMIFCLDNALHFTLAPLLMAVGDGQRGNAFSLLGDIVIKIFSHPFILATVAGLTAAWLEYRPPAAIDQLLASLAAAAAPCALFAMGVSTAIRPLRRIPIELTYLVPIKLLLQPILMYVVLSQVAGIESVWLHSAVLLAALPPATNVFVIAQQYRVWEQRASSTVVVATVLSTVTLSTYLYLVNNGIV